jgi:hypothetical protein
MTVRGQLAMQANRPRRRLQRDVTSLRWGTLRATALLLEREITLTARMLDPSPLTKIIRVGGVNAAAVCGIPAHHLLITKFRIDPPDLAGMNAASDYAVHVELLDNPSPLRGSPEVDFDALLDMLEPVAATPDVPPDRAETWRDRPGLL